MSSLTLVPYATHQFNAIIFLVFILIGFSYSFNKIKPNLNTLKSSLAIILSSYIIFPATLFFIHYVVGIPKTLITALLLVSVFSGSRFSFMTAGVLRLSIQIAFWQVLILRVLSITLAPFIFLFYVQFIQPEVTDSFITSKQSLELLIDTFFLLLLPFLIGLSLNYFVKQKTKKEFQKTLKYGGLIALTVFYFAWIYKGGELILNNWQTELMWVIAFNCFLLLVTYSCSHYLFKLTKKASFTTSISATHCNFILVSSIASFITPWTDELIMTACLWSWLTFLICFLLYLIKKFNNLFPHKSIQNLNYTEIVTNINPSSKG